MKNHLATAVIASLIAMLSVGCASGPAPKAEASPPAAPSKPALTDEAKQALASAEAEASAAKKSYTLWTPAESALKEAQEAAKAGDSAAVIKNAKKVSELTKLGMAQAGYPSTEVK
jgi:murein lipoprotein